MECAIERLSMTKKELRNFDIFFNKAIDEAMGRTRNFNKLHTAIDQVVGIASFSLRRKRRNSGYDIRGYERFVFDYVKERLLRLVERGQRPKNGFNYLMTVSLGGFRQYIAGAAELHRIFLGE